MRDVEYYLMLPWTVRASERRDDGKYTVLEVEELPGFIVTGDPGEELETEFWAALEGFLESYLEDGESPPLPEGILDPLADPPGGVEDARDPTTAKREARSRQLTGTPIHRSGTGSRKPRTGKLQPA